MAQVLESWQLSDDVIEPLRYSLDEASAVAQLPEPLRSRVELVQMAVLVAQFAVAQWEPWDIVCHPAACMLEKLRIESLSDLIQQTRVDLGAIGELMEAGDMRPLRATAAGTPLYPSVPYCNLSKEPFDVLSEILPSMGVSPHRCTLGDVPPDAPAIINCVGIPIRNVLSHFTPQAWHVLVTDVQNTHDDPSSAALLTLPVTIAVIRSTMLKTADESARHGTRPVLA